MRHIVRDSWLAVPRSIIRDEEELRQELTIPNGTYHAAQGAGRPTDGIDPYFICYQETDNYIQVPRNFNIEPWLKDMPAHIREAMILTETQNHVSKHLISADPWEYRPLTWPHKIKLRDHQPPAAEALMYKPHLDRILALACGKGKTVVTLYALCERAMTALPALVVVHTEVLFDQWIERIREHLYLGLADIGRIRGPICDYKDRPFTVAMLQSLTMKEYPQEMYRYFRTVVFDEVHRLGAPQLGKAAPMFLGVRWGLSATHERSDGNDKVFKLHLGNVCYEDLEQDLVPHVYFIRTRVSYDMERFQLPAWARRGGRYNTNTPKLITTLSEDEERNGLILHYIHGAAKKGRVILALGERVEQLMKLASDCKYEAGPLVGPMKKAEKAASLQKQVVFATSKLAKEGLDRPAFDTLAILLPMTDPGWLQQAFGRILRSQDGKRAPRVLIFEDAELPPMTNRCHKIRAWLKRQGIKYTIVEDLGDRDD